MISERTGITACRIDRAVWSFSRSNEGPACAGRPLVPYRPLPPPFLLMWMVSIVVVAGRRRVSLWVTNRPLTASRPTFCVLIAAFSSQVLAGFEVAGGGGGGIRELVERDLEDPQRVPVLRREQRQRRDHRHDGAH